MKNKIIVICLTIVLTASTAMCAHAEDVSMSLNAKSALLMCLDTGDIVYENNAHEKMHPASVTKIMSMLLIMEAIENGKLTLEDEVTTSTYASKKGGSQIWLKEGESMTVNDLLKAVCIGSANDACTVLAEKIAGSEEEFVKMMNDRAKELGMIDTNFENCTGLDDTAENHVTCAYDIALMSRQLMKHDMITKYTTVWMDTLRGGKTELTNTNKLVRFYEGATGLKTGTTAKAGSCLSATATRNGISFVAVVLGCPTSNDRFEGAKTLLNYGFAKYELYTPKIDKKSISNISVINGVTKSIKPSLTQVMPVMIEKGSAQNIQSEINLPASLNAPIEKGQTLGDIQLSIGSENIVTIQLKSSVAVEKMSFSVAIKQVLTAIVS